MTSWIMIKTLSANVFEWEKLKIIVLIIKKIKVGITLNFKKYTYFYINLTKTWDKFWRVHKWGELSLVNKFEGYNVRFVVKWE